MSLYSREGVYFQPASASYKLVNRGRRSRAVATDLFDLILPASLSFVRPPPIESCLSGRDHSGAGRILRCQTIEVDLDACDNGPPAVRRMLQVLLKGLVAFFPAIERLVAQEACNVVGVIGERAPNEACFRELG